MQYALELAKRGAGLVSPNPMVGAVVVYKGEIIGSGWHERHGQAHAEVNAIASVTDQSKLTESTMYVTLEPCNHWGKTPPCSDLIIHHHLKRVVVGCIDPYHEVCGGGIEKIRQAGIEVEVGILEKECRELNKRFFTLHTLQRPYVILKWAETSDHYLGAIAQPPKWMTGLKAKQLVHQWRAIEDAIMVGERTAAADNPALTVREAKGRNPIRIVIDRKMQLPENLHIFDNQAQTILITSYESEWLATHKFGSHPSLHIEAVKQCGNTLPEIMGILCRRRINSVIVEGGRELLQSFIDDSLWDEARVFTAPMTLDELYPDTLNLCGISAPELTNAILTDHDNELRLKYYKSIKSE